MPIYYKEDLLAGSGGGADLTAGDGITIQDDTVSVTTPVKGVTQAEYDALSEEEKNSGLYVITDAESQAGASGTTFIPAVSEAGVISWTNDGGLPNPEPVNIKGPQGPQGPKGEDFSNVYQSAETVIGTWIDGKPIYRMCITGTTPNSDGGYNILPQTQLDSMHIDNIIHMAGTVKGYNDGRTLYHFANIISDVEKLTVHVHFGVVLTISGEWFHNKPFIIILEYTKTTDPATVSQANLLTSEIELPKTLSVDSLNEASAASSAMTFQSVTSMASSSSAKLNS